MKHSLIVALIALPLVAFAGPKEKKEAQQHIEKATSLHKSGKYAEALTELQAAYALDAQPDLLYAIGQIYVKLDKCDDAVASYEKFLATNPPADAANSAKEAIETCKAKQPPPPPPPEPTPPPQPPPPPPQPEARPFYTDVVGSALVGGGLVAGVVAGVLYANARSTLDDADAAATYDMHKDLVDSAEMKRNVSIGLGIVGVAAIGVGIWHYMSYESEQQTVAVTPTTSGGMVTWMGRF